MNIYTDIIKIEIKIKEGKYELAPEEVRDEIVSNLQTLVEQLKVNYDMQSAKSKDEETELNYVHIKIT